MIEDEEALRAVLQDLGREFRDQMKKVADQVADVFKRATQQNVSDTAFLRRVAEEARAEWERHARWVQEAMSRPLVAPEFGEAIRKALDEAHLYYR